MRKCTFSTKPQAKNGGVKGVDKLEWRLCVNWSFSNNDISSCVAQICKQYRFFMWILPRVITLCFTFSWNRIQTFLKLEIHQHQVRKNMPIATVVMATINSLRHNDILTRSSETFINFIVTTSSALMQHQHQQHLHDTSETLYNQNDCNPINGSLDNAMEILNMKLFTIG